jgi:hypothetical protein
VLCAFFTLTFYDLFALRTIGKMHVPYRIAALSSFTSYTIGHNIGATVFTGGAIRFRIYSDWGLTAIDVAKICFISGLTFWLGNTFVLGIGMIWHPAAASSIDLLPESVNQLIAGLLAGIAAYLAWIATGKGRRQLGKDGWKVHLPSAPLTALQILIGVVDLAFCALAMYLLAPANPDLDFVTLSVVFILATLLGFASHAPGSLGVFDAAMLIGLPMPARNSCLPRCWYSASSLRSRSPPRSPSWACANCGSASSSLGNRAGNCGLRQPSRSRRNNSLPSRRRSNSAHKDVACGVPGRPLRSAHLHILASSIGFKNQHDPRHSPAAQGQTFGCLVHNRNALQRDELCARTNTDCPALRRARRPARDGHADFLGSPQPFPPVSRRARFHPAGECPQRP